MQVEWWSEPVLFTEAALKAQNEKEKKNTKKTHTHIQKPFDFLTIRSIYFNLLKTMFFIL